MNDWKIDEYKFSNDILHKDVIITTISDKNIARYIVEACNNYEQLKEENEKLKEALNKIDSITDNNFEYSGIIHQICEETLSHSTK